MTDESTSIAQGDLQDQKIAAYQSPLGVTRTQSATLRGVRLQSGAALDPVEVAYQTLGTLSARRDNAILVCHALSGTAHVAGLHPDTGRPGWWDYHVGPGKAVDTDKFFVVCSNVLGGCDGTTGPMSPRPGTGRPYGMEFPEVTVGDMVAVQAKLMEHLGIPRLFAAIGGSMGGMQALEWAVSFPDRVRLCVPIATCSSHNAMQIAFNEIGRHAIISDPNWNGGNYTAARRPNHGLAVARMVGHVTYLSEYAMTRKFGRTLQPPVSPAAAGGGPFSVGSYLHHQGESFVSRFDPNTYICLTRALDQFDLFGGRPPEEVLGRVKARFLVVSFASDWLYPPAQSRELVRQLKRARVAATYINLETLYGHDSFLIQNPEFSQVVRHYLEHEYRQAGLKEAGAAS
jgi:homoserine O-acetyltransferase